MTEIDYGFVDSNNLLLEIIKFNEGDIESIEFNKKQFNAAAYYLLNEPHGPAVPKRSIWISNENYFTPGKPFNTWLWDEKKYIWVSPIPYPIDGQTYTWSDEIVNWVQVQSTIV